MSARSAARPLAFLILAVALVMAAGATPDAQPVSATHDGHRIAKYFVLPFIKDVPNDGSAFIQVYDCAGGHEHAGLLGPATNAWNKTGRVNFLYILESTTPCDAVGRPLTEGRITVFHNQSINTADYDKVTAPEDAFRDNDVGTEGDIGMYPLRKGRVRIRLPDPPGPPPVNSTFDSHTVAAVVHELGHAAGLADLYNHDEPPPCVSLPHDPDTTIMDCSPGPTPGQHDIDNLRLLYERASEQVNDFLATAETPDEISFRWTDRS